MRNRYSAVLIAIMLLTGFQMTARAGRPDRHDPWNGAGPAGSCGSRRDDHRHIAGAPGSRTSVSDGEGNYTLAALPAGQCEVTFELAGFTTVKKRRP